MKIINVINKPNSIIYVIQINDDITKNITLSRTWINTVTEKEVIEYLKDICNRCYKKTFDINSNSLIGKEL